MVHRADHVEEGTASGRNRSSSAAPFSTCSATSRATESWTCSPGTGVMERVAAQGVLRARPTHPTSERDSVGSDWNEARPPVGATNGKQMRVKGAAVERAEVVLVLCAQRLASGSELRGRLIIRRGRYRRHPMGVRRGQGPRVLDLAGSWTRRSAKPKQSAVVVAKRRGKPAEEWDAVVRLEDFATMVAALQAAVYG